MQGLGLMTTSRAAVSVGVSGPRPSPRAGHPMRAAKTKLVVTRRATQKNQEERNNKEVGVSSSTENESDVWTESFGKKSQAVATAVDDMLYRYDWTSALSGSSLVACYCMMRGQSPTLAVSIALTATVIAVVINEMMEESYSDN